MGVAGRTLQPGVCCVATIACGITRGTAEGRAAGWLKRQKVSLMKDLTILEENY